MNFNVVSRSCTPSVVGRLDSQRPQHHRGALRNFLVQGSGHDERHLSKPTLYFFIQAGHALFVGFRQLNEVVLCILCVLGHLRIPSDDCRRYRKALSMNSIPTKASIPGTATSTRTNTMPNAILRSAAIKTTFELQQRSSPVPHRALDLQVVLILRTRRLSRNCR